MNIAISNIAWNTDENETVLHILQELSIKGLEIAPTKIWSNPLEVSTDQLLAYKNTMQKNNIQIVAMQSLLFNHPELQIFESKENRKATIQYLEQIIKIGSAIGAKVLVFGSPKNRNIPSQISTEDANTIAQDFFKELGDVAQKYGLIIGIEPNPSKYGTNFFTTSQEVIDFIVILNHPAVRVHLDTGAMYVNKENYTATIEKALPYLTHFHISHDNLDDITLPGIDYQAIADVLRSNKYDKWISIEMRSLSENNSDRVKQSLLLVKKYFL